MAFGTSARYEDSNGAVGYWDDYENLAVFNTYTQAYGFQIETLTEIRNTLVLDASKGFIGGRFYWDQNAHLFRIDPTFNADFTRSLDLFNIEFGGVQFSEVGARFELAGRQYQFSWGDTGGIGDDLRDLGLPSEVVDQFIDDLRSLGDGVRDFNDIVNQARPSFEDVDLQTATTVMLDVPFQSPYGPRYPLDDEEITASMDEFEDARGESYYSDYKVNPLAGLLLSTGNGPEDTFYEERGQTETGELVGGAERNLYAFDLDQETNDAQLTLVDVGTGGEADTDVLFLNGTFGSTVRFQQDGVHLVIESDVGPTVTVLNQFVPGTAEVDYEIEYIGMRDATYAGAEILERVIADSTRDVGGTAGADVIDAAFRDRDGDFIGNYGQRIDGFGGNDRLYAGHAGDTLFGGNGSDTLDGGYGADTLYGGRGNDSYWIDDAGDRVVEGLTYSQGGGTDTVYASIDYTLGDRQDILRLLDTALGNDLSGAGNSLDNSLVGNTGGNTLNGAWGRDNINGKAGDDVLIGGRLADTLVGDSGADVFVYTHVADSRAGSSNRDFINGFDRGQDQIDLSDVGVDSFIGRAGFSGAAGEVRYISLTSSNANIVEVDTTGNGTADMQIFVNQTTWMTGSDFMF